MLGGNGECVAFSESEWRLLRSVHRAALDRYCKRVLEECAATIGETDSSPHDRYLRLYRMLKERDMGLSTAFDDMRRSTALERLAAMIAVEAVTDEELNQFSASTRESANILANSPDRSATLYA
jgi:hypothetical protein